MNQVEQTSIGDSETKPMISLVLPCFNENEVFPYLRAALTDIADSLANAFRAEIILVNDGSKLTIEF